MDKTVSLKIKRDTMELCHKLIPLMNKEEIGLIGISLFKAMERLKSEDRVILED